MNSPFDRISGFLGGLGKRKKHDAPDDTGLDWEQKIKYVDLGGKTQDGINASEFAKYIDVMKGNADGKLSKSEIEKGLKQLGAWDSFSKIIGGDVTVEAFNKLLGLDNQSAMLDVNGDGNFTKLESDLLERIANLDGKSGFSDIEQSVFDEVKSQLKGKKLESIIYTKYSTEELRKIETTEKEKNKAKFVTDTIAALEGTEGEANTNIEKEVQWRADNPPKADSTDPLDKFRVTIDKNADEKTVKEQVKKVYLQTIADQIIDGLDDNQSLSGTPYSDGLKLSEIEKKVQRDIYELIKKGDLTSEDAIDDKATELNNQYKTLEETLNNLDGNSTTSTDIEKEVRKEIQEKLDSGKLSLKDAADEAKKLYDSKVKKDGDGDGTITDYDKALVDAIRLFSERNGILKDKEENKLEERIIEFLKSDDYAEINNGKKLDLNNKQDVFEALGDAEMLFNNPTFLEFITKNVTPKNEGEGDESDDEA